MIWYDIRLVALPSTRSASGIWWRSRTPLWQPRYNLNQPNFSCLSSIFYLLRYLDLAFSFISFILMVHKHICRLSPSFRSSLSSSPQWEWLWTRCQAWDTGSFVSTAGMRGFSAHRYWSIKAVIKVLRSFDNQNGTFHLYIELYEKTVLQDTLYHVFHHIVQWKQHSNDTLQGFNFCIFQWERE